jgi:hypothetical protein
MAIFSKTIKNRNLETTQNVRDESLKPRHRNSKSQDGADALKSEREEVRIAYPKEGEIISGPRYAFQIGTIPQAISVEISIDGGEWKPCRESLGLWWHDWEDFNDGAHQAQARIHKNGPTIAFSALRNFIVSKEVPSRQ